MLHCYIVTMLRALRMVEIFHRATYQLGVGVGSHFLNHVVLLPSADDHADVGALSVLRTELLQLMARELARKDAEQVHLSFYALYCDVKARFF